jgi:hypothetical protein
MREKNPMQRQPVSSSSLASLGYSKESSTLEVEFRSGIVYRYFAVPLSVFTELLQSESKGTFHNRFIRGVFPFDRA